MSVQAIGVAHGFFVANRRAIGRLCHDCEDGADGDDGVSSGGAACRMCKHQHYLLDGVCLPTCPLGYRPNGLGNFNRRCEPTAMVTTIAPSTVGLVRPGEVSHMPALPVDIHLCGSQSTFAEDELPNYIYLAKTPELLQTERQLLSVALHALGETAADKLLTEQSLVYGKSENMHTTAHWFQTMTLIAATNAISFGPSLAEYFRHSAYSHFGWQVPVSHDYCSKPR